MSLTQVENKHIVFVTSPLLWPEYMKTVFMALPPLVQQELCCYIYVTLTQKRHICQFPVGFSLHFSSHIQRQRAKHRLNYKFVVDFFNRLTKCLVVSRQQSTCTWVVVLQCILQNASNVQTSLKRQTDKGNQSLSCQ